ncbi:glycosyltransferase [Sulfurospirillum sp. 1612]|uniref:glycosyltransferase n=1 Tax=Sulfurospirillum sp. 1612 TaxID=3094835 RepID=UPI002F93B1E7
MKINIIIPSFYPAVVYGGPIFSSLNTSKELAALDNVEVFVSTTNTNMTSKLDVETNKYIELENDLYVKYYNETIVGKFSLALFLNIYKDIKQSDVVNIQAIFNTPVPISLLYAKLFQKPILISTRGALCKWCIGQGNSFKQIWLNFFIKPFIKNVYWHATCEAEKKDILNIFPEAKIVIIPNGVDVKSYDVYNFLSKNEYMKKYIDKDVTPSHIIVSMSRLHAKKGFDILIKSFVFVLEKFPDSVLLIAGPDEGEQKNLENLIKDLKLENQIYLVGSISNQDKIDFLANADVFALPSHNENFGNVYVESLASGTPIVASTGTPWQEVEKENCGKWVHNSVNETSIAILEMLKQDREVMRVNAKKLAKKYDWENIAVQFKEVFEKMVK